MDANKIRDRWGVIHARPLPVAFYDTKRFQPSPQGVEYFRSMFTNALGAEDVESIRSIFDIGNLIHPFDSVNVHVHKRIRRLPPET
jgi:hypothetical protein